MHAGTRQVCLESCASAGGLYVPPPGPFSRIGLLGWNLMHTYFRVSPTESPCTELDCNLAAVTTIPMILQNGHIPNV